MKGAVRLMPPYVLAVFLLFPILLLWRLPRPQPRGRPAGTLPSVSVVVPAYNEEARLTPLLETLQQQTVQPIEVLVVDDSSTDGTAALARRLGATVVAAGPRPSGWHGKTWACWQGALHSRGQLLVFLDADTWLAPTGLEALVETHMLHGGLVSVQPYHVTHRLHEQMAAFFNLVVVASLNAFTPLGERLPAGGAFGPCIVCTRKDYQRLGGHAAVRGETVEDVPLGRRFEQAGLPNRLYVGRGVVYFRMYPGGLHELVEGYTKNLSSGALSVHAWAAVLITLWVAGCFSVTRHLLGSLLSAPPADDALWWGLLYVAYAVQIGWALRRIGSFQAWVAPLFPIPLTFFALVMARSLVLTHILGRVCWKGRVIPTRRRAWRASPAGWPAEVGDDEDRL